MKSLLLSIILCIGSSSIYANDKVFALCTATQGNGYNWGSTLGWLSEIVSQEAQKAEYHQKKTGQKSLIDLSCQTGSSSSGFLTSLYDQLLKSSIIKNSKGTKRKLLSIQEVKEVSKALRVLSLSTDFHGKEATSFRKEGLKIKLALWSDKNNDNKLKKNHWTHIANANMVMDTFMVWINGARQYQSNWHEQTAPLFAVRSLDDYDRIPQKKKDEVNQQLKEKMFLARNLIDSATDISQEIKAESLSNDFCNTVYMQPAQPSLKKPFNYNELSLLYLCNEQTMKKLSQSTLFKEMLNNSNHMAKKILIGSVADWKSALNITMREPNLLNELSGTLREIGLTNVKQYKNGKFQTIDLNSNFLVMGGFPGPRLQAWASKALLEERVESLRSQGYDVSGRTAIFGKIDIRDRIGSFAEKTIVEFYGGEDKLRPFYEWQDELCDFKNDGNGIDFYSMDWNLTNQPAAFGDLAYILTAKGINLARIQTNPTQYEGIKATPYVYDSMSDEKFLPIETTMCN